MTRQLIIVKGMATERDAATGALYLRVSDALAAETVLEFGPVLAGHLPQLIIEAQVKHTPSAGAQCQS